MAVRSGQEVANAMVQAGFPQSAVAEGLATFWLESGWDDTAQSPTGCCGVSQQCPCVGQGDMVANLQAAFKKWQGCNGGSFDCDWWRYGTGPSNPRWGEAQQKASGITGSGTPSGSQGVGLQSAVQKFLEAMKGNLEALLGFTMILVAGAILLLRTDFGKEVARTVRRSSMFVATRGMLW